MTLVTQCRNRPAFERSGLPLDKITFIDSEVVARPCNRLGRWLTRGRGGGLAIKGAVAWPAYLYFERLVWQRFGPELYAGKFDLVHRLTPLSPVYPSPIAAKCPVPFVLGPINGAVPWPRGTAAARWKEAGPLSPFRGSYRWLPYVRRTYRRAAVTMSATQVVRDELQRFFGISSVVLPENGVDTGTFTPAGRTSPGRVRPLTLLFVGRLIRLKNPDLIIDAVAESGISPEDIRIQFVGAGPEEDLLRRRARSLNLDSSVRIQSWVPHQELPRWYREASLLVLPSIHESGGAVLLEAMACGLPCAVVNHGGPAEYISDETGFRIPVGSRQEMTADLARLFRDLRADRSRLDAASRAATSQVESTWAWSAKAEKLLSVYEAVLQRHASTPSHPELACSS